MNTSCDYVFGYGSLASCSDLSEFLGRTLLPGKHVFPARLDGFYRAWDASLDLTDVTEAAQYRALDVNTRTNISACVTFLTIHPNPGSSVNGVVFPVTAEELARLDERELNWARLDVSGEVEPRLEGTVWTYSANEIARSAYQAGKETGRSVISRAYVDIVRDAFLALGKSSYDEFVATTRVADIPTVDIKIEANPHYTDDSRET